MSYMKLRLNSPISLDDFIHDPSKQCFYNEASSLKGNIFQPIYDDACDVGFLVCNPKSGQTILVTLFKTNFDNHEGEAESWVFTPSDRDVRAHPKLKNYKFLIYND